MDDPKRPALIVLCLQDIETINNVEPQDITLSNLRQLFLKIDSEYYMQECAPAGRT